MPTQLTESHGYDMLSGEKYKKWTIPDGYEIIPVGEALNSADRYAAAPGMWSNYGGDTVIINAGYCVCIRKKKVEKPKKYEEIVDFTVGDLFYSPEAFNIYIILQTNYAKGLAPIKYMFVGCNGKLFQYSNDDLYDMTKEQIIAHLNKRKCIFIENLNKRTEKMLDLLGKKYKIEG